MRYLASLFLLCLLAAGCSQNGFNAKPASTEDDSVPSATKTTMSVAPQTMADGVSRSTVQVVFRNYIGEPLSGFAMDLKVSGRGNSITPCSVSNKFGLSTCYITSTVAETKSVSIVGAFTLTQSTIFMSTGQGKLLSTLASGGGSQKAPSGQKLLVTIGSVNSSLRNLDSNGTARLKANLQGQIWDN